MWFLNRLRLWKHLASPATRSARRGKVPTTRLCLEALEDRVVPSTCTISGTVLDASTNTGPGSGWNVWLDVNNNQRLDPGEPSAAVQTNGTYTLNYDSSLSSGITTSNGSQYDIVRLDLQDGSGGRWVNNTPMYAIVSRTTAESGATNVNFGVTFQPNTGVAPVGSESPVNVNATTAPPGYLNGTNVSVSADTNSMDTTNYGDYVVGWENYTTGTVYARVFNADGSARTGEISVGQGQTPSSSNAYYYQMPKVAMAGDGEFMVAWNGPDGIHSQAYTLDGAPVGSPSTVLAFNSKTTGWLSDVAAADSTGDFVVVYNAESINHFGQTSTPTVYAQRYTSSGSANGKAIQVATPELVNGTQSVAMDSNGNFVVAWDDDVIANHHHQSTTTTYVYAQQYTASGSAVGSQITVAQGTSSPSVGNGMTLTPSVAMNAAGQFVVAYEDRASSIQGMAQVYNASGTAGAAVAFTNSETDPNPAAVAMDSAGNVMFSWATPARGNNRTQVRMAWLQAGTSTATPETIVNSTTQGLDQLPGVAATGNGSFVVAWQGNGAADPAGIYSQRYAVLQIGSFTANPNPATAGSSTTTGSTVTLTASNLTDAAPGATITQVAFYLDTNNDGTLETTGTNPDTLLGTVTESSNGSWSLIESNAMGLTAGTYTLFAQAEDSDGVFSAPVALTLTVQ